MSDANESMSPEKIAFVVGQREEGEYGSDEANNISCT